MAVTALDLIKGALRRINSYQSGESIASPDAQDCLETLNDLFDSLSTDKNSVVGTIENILQWVPGKNQYTIGNPTSDFLGLAPFTGTLTGGSPIITGVTNTPIGLIVGATLTDVANVIPGGTKVLSIGTNTVTMTANASATPSSNPDSIGYTIPGDFAITRPLRITGGYTRFNNLDFTLDVYATQDQYNSVLYKAQPGPWPTIGWYNSGEVYGTLNVYMTPGNAADLHLFTDAIMGNLTLNQAFSMPPGYNRWIKWLLAKEICGEFGFPMSETIKINAADAESKIKALNAEPAAVGTYDRALTGAGRANASWIFSGGY
jgi:hypothetical protein